MENIKTARDLEVYYGKWTRRELADECIRLSEKNPDRKTPRKLIRSLRADLMKILAVCHGVSVKNFVFSNNKLSDEKLEELVSLDKIEREAYEDMMKRKSKPMRFSITQLNVDGLPVFKDKIEKFPKANTNVRDLIESYLFNIDNDAKVTIPYVLGITNGKKEMAIGRLYNERECWTNYSQSGSLEIIHNTRTKSIVPVSKEMFEISTFAGKNRVLNHRKLFELISDMTYRGNVECAKKYVDAKIKTMMDTIRYYKLKNEIYDKKVSDVVDCVGEFCALRKVYDPKLPEDEVRINVMIDAYRAALAKYENEIRYEMVIKVINEVNEIVGKFMSGKLMMSVDGAGDTKVEFVGTSGADIIKDSIADVVIRAVLLKYCAEPCLDVLWICSTIFCFDRSVEDEVLRVLSENVCGKIALFRD